MLRLNDIEHRIRPVLMNPHSTIFDSERESSRYVGLFRTAAVLIIIHCKYHIPHVLFTRRSSKLKSHTGEISFPGGQYSCGQDSNLLDTALRETEEEIGLCFRAENIRGRLKSVHTLTSDFTIVPYITLQRHIAEPKISKYEVDCIIDIPLEDTLSTFQPDIEHYDSSQQGVYKFTYHGIVIWGATARILKQLYDHLAA